VTVCEVLLVEDDPDLARLTQHAFDACNDGARLQVCTDGQQALEHLQSDAALPELVLLDLELPEVDGFGVLEAIREDSELTSLPVVVLTSSAAAEDRDRCYELGANAYVTKPVDFDDYRSVIETLTGFWLNVNVSP
jgi:CheY-like chemotaxis protein